MLANLICWIIALGMMLAMGFIFLCTISKAVDVYKDIHKNAGASQTSPIMERENK